MELSCWFGQVKINWWVHSPSLKRLGSRRRRNVYDDGSRRRRPWSIDQVCDQLSIFRFYFLAIKRGAREDCEHKNSCSIHPSAIVKYQAGLVGWLRMELVIIPRYSSYLQHHKRQSKTTKLKTRQHLSLYCLAAKIPWYHFGVVSVIYRWDGTRRLGARLYTLA